MSIYKCKNCGGELEPQDNGLGKCLYCGALQTLPKDKDDKVQNLLNRANDFRLACDFDRAIYTYEEVLKLNETEPEAHWGLFLSKYGVEYVKDNTSYTYKPTLHRISSVSVFDDVDYKATLKYADVYSAPKYKADAEVIEAVMKELLVLSANQDSYDVFLSYKEADDITRKRTDDSFLAHDLYNELTARGYKVFFAPKSLVSGLFEPKIYSAIISSKVMIVLGTKPEYFNAVWVKNEWSRFVELIEHGERKMIVPVYKGMEAGELPSRLAKYQAIDMISFTFLDKLTSIIDTYISQQSRVKFDRDATAEDKFIERGLIALEDRNFSQANSFFENALNLNPHSAQAYFGKLMIDIGVNKQEQILTAPKYLNAYPNFEKALRYADHQLKIDLVNYEEKVADTIETKSRNEMLNSLRSNKSFDNVKNIYYVSNNLRTEKSKRFKTKLKDVYEKISYAQSQIDSFSKIIEKNNNDIKSFDSKKRSAKVFKIILPIVFLVLFDFLMMAEGTFSIEYIFATYNKNPSEFLLDLGLVSLLGISIAAPIGLGIGFGLDKLVDLTIGRIINKYGLSKSSKKIIILQKQNTELEQKIKIEQNEIEKTINGFIRIMS